MKSITNYFIQPNLSIIFGFTCFFILGIISGKVVENNYITCALYICSVLSAITVIALNIKSNVANNNTISKNAITISLMLASLVAGNINYKKQQQKFLSFYNQYQNKTCSISGIITDIEYMPKHQRIKECITLDITNITTTDSCITDTATEKKQAKKIDRISIQIYTPFKTSCKVSDTIEIKNIPIKKQNNSSFFSYLVKKNINASVFLTRNNTIITKNRPNYSLARLIFDIKYQILERIRNKMPRQSFALFSSLFLGNKTLVKNNIMPFARHFRQWGISHYLARSGLHLTIFTFIWLMLFRFFPFSFFFKQLFMLLLCSIYLVFSWSSISFLRAFYSFFLYTICNICKIPIHFLHILTLVTLYVAICNPIQIFFLDFQLSFALTFALALIANLYPTKQANSNKY